jgi:hypothetical protein
LFEVTRSLSSDKPIHVNHVAGSLGTFMQVNPSVRVYTMNARHHVPIDQKVYEFNLERANNGDPTFTLYSDFHKDFEMPNLSP